MGAVRSKVCTPCRFKHRKCDELLVCQSCVLHGCEGLCDSQKKKKVETKSFLLQILPKVENPISDPVHTIQSEYEAFLFHHWCMEIAPWHDLFDEDKHFSRRVSAMARESRVLMSATLAYAAKKLRRTGYQSGGADLTYYNESILLLISALNEGKEGDFSIATVVVLCGLEIMDASCDNWQKHLNGILSMLSKTKMLSFSSLRRAAFWIFAREDTLLSIIQKKPTHLDPNLWDLTGDGLRDDIQANKMLRILALTSNYVAGKPDPEVQRHLFSYLEEFREQLPRKCEAIVTIAGEIPKDLYSTMIQSSMFQMYHLAYILLYGPQDARAERHAIGIIAIANSGLDPTAKVNSIQPMVYAGQVLKKTDHRTFVLYYLEQIERELGWTTTSKRKELRDMWRTTSIWNLIN